MITDFILIFIKCSDVFLKIHQRKGFFSFFLTFLYTNASDCMPHSPPSIFCFRRFYCSQVKQNLHYSIHMCVTGALATPGNNISDFLKNYNTGVTSKQRKKSWGHHLFLGELGLKRWTLSVVVRLGLWGWVGFQLGQTIERNYAINMTKVKVFLGIKKKKQKLLCLWVTNLSCHKK